MTFVKTNNPFAKSFDGLMNELINELPSTLSKTVRQDVFGFPPVNIVEKADHYHLQLAAPGFDKGDFNIKLEGETLTISAEKKEDTKSETDKVIRNEFNAKTFKRSFTLDEKIDATNIEASYINGVLTLNLPKKETVKASATKIVIK